MGKFVPTSKHLFAVFSVVPVSQFANRNMESDEDDDIEYATTTTFKETSTTSSLVEMVDNKACKTLVFSFVVALGKFALPHQNIVGNKHSRIRQ